MARIDYEFIDSYRTVKKSSLDKGKTLVIVIDMVKGFCERGAMADSAIKDIASDIAGLLNYYPHALFFRDAHEPDSTELSVFPSHCLKGTEESEIINELKDFASRSAIVLKNSTNGFMAPNFMENAEDTAKKFDNFILTGCCTDICVLQFGLSWMGYLQQYNYAKKTVYLPLNAVDTYHAQGAHDVRSFNKMAVRLMENAGIKVVKKIG